MSEVFLVHHLLAALRVSHASTAVMSVLGLCLLYAIPAGLRLSAQAAACAGNRHSWRADPRFLLLEVLFVRLWINACRRSASKGLVHAEAEKRAAACDVIGTLAHSVAIVVEIALAGSASCARPGSDGAMALSFLAWFAPFAIITALANGEMKKGDKKV